MAKGICHRGRKFKVNFPDFGGVPIAASSHPGTGFSFDVQAGVTYQIAVMGDRRGSGEVGFLVTGP